MTHGVDRGIWEHQTSDSKSTALPGKETNQGRHKDCAGSPRDQAEHWKADCRMPPKNHEAEDTGRLHAEDLPRLGRHRLKPDQVDAAGSKQTLGGVVPEVFANWKNMR